MGNCTADGREVVFISGAPNLVPKDTGYNNDIFVRDMMTGGPELTLANVAGGQAAQLSITGGSPLGIVIVGAPLGGQGVMPSPRGPLELAGPMAYFAFGLDAGGDLSVNIPLHPALSGLPLWVQGIDLGLDFPTSLWAGVIQ